jgi:hypothetical protein
MAPKRFRDDLDSSSGSATSQEDGLLPSMVIMSSVQEVNTQEVHASGSAVALLCTWPYSVCKQELDARFRHLQT